MPMHLSVAELDVVHRMAGEHKTTEEIHARICADRGRSRKPHPDIGTVRRAMRGRTHQQGVPETRGRKRSLSRTNVMALNKTRKRLVKQAKGEAEVHWPDVQKKTRGVPKCDPTTVSRSFAREGLDVKWRNPRMKPQRDPEHEEERVEVCSKWQNYPVKISRWIEIWSSMCNSSCLVCLAVFIDGISSRA